MGASIFCLVRLARTCRTATAWCKMQLRQCKENHIWDLLRRMPITKSEDVRTRLPYPPHRKIGEFFSAAYPVPGSRLPIVWHRTLEHFENVEIPVIPFAVFMVQALEDGPSPVFSVRALLSRSVSNVGSSSQIGSIHGVSMCRFAMFEDDIHFIFREQFPAADPDDLVARLRKEVAARKDEKN